MSLTFEALFGTYVTDGIEILNASVAASLFSLCNDLSEAHTKKGTYISIANLEIPNLSMEHSLILKKSQRR